MCILLIAAWSYEGIADAMLPKYASVALSLIREALPLHADNLDCSKDAAAFRLAQYGPLNSLSTRLNEVMVRVKM